MRDYTSGGRTRMSPRGWKKRRERGLGRIDCHLSKQSVASRRTGSIGKVTCTRELCEWASYVWQMHDNEKRVMPGGDLERENSIYRVFKSR